jgi:hypothetical protein
VTITHPLRREARRLYEEQRSILLAGGSVGSVSH